MAYLLPHGGCLHSAEYWRKEGILILLEYLGLQAAVEELGICRMYGCGLPYHTVQIDGHLGQPSCAHHLLDDEHDLLGPSHGEDGYQYLTALLRGLLQQIMHLLGCLHTAGLVVLGPTVCGFYHQGLEAYELVDCGIEEPGLLEFVVPGECDIMESVAYVEVGHR